MYTLNFDKADIIIDTNYYHEAIRPVIHMLNTNTEGGSKRHKSTRKQMSKKKKKSRKSKKKSRKSRRKPNRSPFF